MVLSHQTGVRIPVALPASTRRTPRSPALRRIASPPVRSEPPKRQLARRGYTRVTRHAGAPMVELNHRDRTIKVKLVYYGPPVGGKTTNLQILHRCADAKRRGELISINSAQDRTILFDLLPLKTPGFRGFDLRLQVLAVPGQAMYSATRRLVLKGADALVFVANSALDRWEENIQSYREMTQNLLSHHLDPASMPLVFQYNKRDLPQVLEVEALDRALNGRRAEVIPAVAVRGEGVLETFGIILARAVQDLASRYAILDVKEGAPARQWAEQALLELFGRTRLAFDAQASPATRPMPRAEPPAAAPAGRPTRRRPLPPATPWSGWRRRPPCPRKALAPRAPTRRRASSSRPTPRPPPSWAPRSPSCARSATSRASASRTFGRPWRRRRTCSPARRSRRRSSPCSRAWPASRAPPTRPSGSRRPASRPARPRSSRWTPTPCSPLPRPCATSRRARCAGRSRPSPSPRRTSTSARRSTAPGTASRRCSPCPSAPRAGCRGWASSTTGRTPRGRARRRSSTSPRSRAPCPSPSSWRRRSAP